MSDKVLLAKTDQPPPTGYIRVTPPAPWKMKTLFDVKPDDLCPSCWGSGAQRQVVPGKEERKKRQCDCLLSRVVRHLERLNRGPAKAPSSAQETTKQEPMSEQARTAIARLERELEALDEQRGEALARLQLAVTKSLEETEAAQGRFDSLEEARGAAVDTANDLRVQADELRRRAAVLDENRLMLEGLAAMFVRDQAAAQSQLDGYKRHQSQLSEELARAAGRWDKRARGPRNRLERMRRRLGLEGPRVVVGVDPAAGPDMSVAVVAEVDPNAPIPFRITEVGRREVSAPPAQAMHGAADAFGGEDFGGAS
jgi:hypothetical protein